VRIETDKAAMVVNMLAEGCGIRAISRLTNLNKNTVLNVLETAGRHCEQFMADSRGTFPLPGHAGTGLSAWNGIGLWDSNSPWRKTTAAAEVENPKELPTPLFESTLTFRGNPLAFAPFQPTVGWL
jgi:lambda repressor-like predicted transcriptional regulator